jgi:hypothetical protein
VVLVDGFIMRRQALCKPWRLLCATTQVFCRLPAELAIASCCWPNAKPLFRTDLRLAKARSALLALSLVQMAANSPNENGEFRSA